jgi:hypothetical protein
MALLERSAHDNWRKPPHSLLNGKLHFSSRNPHSLKMSSNYGLMPRSHPDYGLHKIHKAGVPLWGSLITYRLAEHLSQSTGTASEHHVMSSEDFICTLNTLRVNPKDIIASFDVISLPVKGAIYGYLASCTSAV